MRYRALYLIHTQFFSIVLAIENQLALMRMIPALTLLVAIDSHSQ